MKRLILTFSLFLTIVCSLKAQCHLITTTKSGKLIQSTPELYFYVRTPASYSAVKMIMVNITSSSAAQLKFKLRLTTGINIKPIAFGAKLADGSNLILTIKHTKKSTNDNKRMADDNFEASLTSADVDKLQNLHVKSWLILNSQNSIISEIPVNDERNFQEQLACLSNKSNS
ncbi:hypothetical protein [Mucilaginibacter koreensis]